MKKLQEHGNLYCNDVVLLPPCGHLRYYMAKYASADNIVDNTVGSE